MALTFKQQQAFNYDLYLLGRLALQTGLLSEEIEIDDAFEQVVNWYEEFYISEFNDFEKGSYECIMEYITHKLQIG